MEFESRAKAFLESVKDFGLPGNVAAGLEPEEGPELLIDLDHGRIVIPAEFVLDNGAPGWEIGAAKVIKQAAIAIQNKQSEALNLLQKMAVEHAAEDSGSSKAAEQAGQASEPAVETRDEFIFTGSGSFGARRRFEITVREDGKIFLGEIKPANGPKLLSSSFGNACYQRQLSREEAIGIKTFVACWMRLAKAETIDVTHPSTIQSVGNGPFSLGDQVSFGSHQFEASELANIFRALIRWGDMRKAVGQAMTPGAAGAGKKNLTICGRRPWKGSRSPKRRVPLDRPRPSLRFDQAVAGRGRHGGLRTAGCAAGVRPAAHGDAAVGWRRRKGVSAI